MEPLAREIESDAHIVFARMDLPVEVVMVAFFRIQPAQAHEAEPVSLFELVHEQHERRGLILRDALHTHIIALVRRAETVERSLRDHFMMILFIMLFMITIRIMRIHFIFYKASRYLTMLIIQV